MQRLGAQSGGARRMHRVRRRSVSACRRHRLSQAIRIWKGVKSPEAVFVAACKEGRKPEAQQAKSGVIVWFEWARRDRGTAGIRASAIRCKIL
ncbi:MAG: hypothetical protein KME32_25960 [Mojavia pulchra JT2-VF2]|jgi:hypothetical protein|uniref:Uncharacterized protein n=1 Tax=Mojavia pulchra JT2-VF2 TaxID=287848 RepID=A0A951Q3B2_9NOST|nr:hypothetical protein [Mojavia pulchra JT2-VF2]